MMLKGQPDVLKVWDDASGVEILKGVQKTTMGAKTGSYKVGDIEFYRVVKLSGLGWKVFFRLGGEKWVGTIVARRYIAFAPDTPPTGVRVTLKSRQMGFRFSKNWVDVSPPSDKGGAKLLVALTFNEMGVL